MRRFLVYVLFLYVFVLAYAGYFYLIAIEVGLAADMAAFFAITLLPLIFLLLYAFRERLGLDAHETLLIWLVFITFVVAAVITGLLIVPLVYG